MTSFFSLKRLRVLKAGQAAYDERFHLGTNIIRGENGSGKSTIADFIFYALGGEFDSWKESAALCDEVQAEVETASATITVRRAIAGKQEPAFVYFGPMEEASQRGLDGWERFPIRRGSDSNLSFSQVMFRSSGIPEAPNVGGSNITVHQVLRLLYSDQQTPAGKLFRFETFDTRDIRQAVGDLIIGVNGYELYETQLELRTLRQEYQEKDRAYTAGLGSLPSSEGLTSIATLDQRISELASELAGYEREITEVDDKVSADAADAFVADRRKRLGSVQKLQATLRQHEDQLSVAKGELEEIAEFQDHLEHTLSLMEADDRTADLLGDIEFTHCPACLQPLKEGEADHCILCGKPLDPEREKSRFLELKLDTQLQVRETRQLSFSKAAEIEDLERMVREERRAYKQAVASFSADYDVSNSPRETFLAERNRRIGRIESEVGYLEELREVISRLDELSRAREALNNRIVELDALQKRLLARSQARLAGASTLISNIGKSLLRQDLERQEEFENPVTFTVNFADDAMLVNGKMNFAESSNVILKNTSLLSIFSAATADDEFWHPRFLLLDNVEDKGMEQVRSHNFQKLIVQQSRAAKDIRHQIIFTTSMMNPELESADLTVGPRYTRQHKSLALL